MIDRESVLIFYLIITAGVAILVFLGNIGAFDEQEMPKWPAPPMQGDVSSKQNNITMVQCNYYNSTGCCLKSCVYNVNETYENKACPQRKKE